MRLVHLSDIHLGYRQYQRLTPNGINQREWDVANSFRQSIDKIIGLKPDVVLIAGDMFHSSRPTNAAILHAFRQLLRLRHELPDTAVVMIAGDHDTPRTTESGSIMGLFESIDVHVAAGEARQFRISDDLAVLAVPDLAEGVPQLKPDLHARHNVLLIHADVDDVVPRYYADLDRAGIRVSRRDLDLARWSYVALGHYHVYQPVADNAFYSGSLDYTSLNVWYDLEEGRGRKGFIEFDLETREHVFHPLVPSRQFVDRAISAANKSPAEVDAAIRRIVDKVDIDNKVVRIVLRDIARPVARELDQRAIRDYKRRAVSFHLDARRPETARRDAAGAPARRPSVLDFVREQLSTRTIPADLDRGRFVELGTQYLTQADATPAAGAVESGS
jgi:exonuclease SbcD